MILTYFEYEYESEEEYEHDHDHDDYDDDYDDDDDDEPSPGRIPSVFWVQQLSCFDGSNLHQAFVTLVTFP